MNFLEIEQTISWNGWYFFGTKQFNCPPFTQALISQYLREEKLPTPCDTCYKGLLFWGILYSKENVRNFFDMIKTYDRQYRGKFNRSMVVLYFREKSEMFRFLDFLRENKERHGVKAGIQWRRACKEFQNLNPKLWKNGKTFLPDKEN